MTDRFTVGLFVGGRSTRMGGVTKGLLKAPDTGEPLAVRLARVAREALPNAKIVLVGDAEAYAAFGIPALADDPGGIGPLGGLRALLRDASRDQSMAVALASDLPYVTSSLVAHIAHYATEAPAAAPKGRGGKWEPLFARYAPEPCLPIVQRLIEAKRHALRRIFDALGEGAAEAPMDDASIALLADWDSPADIHPRQ